MDFLETLQAGGLDDPERLMLIVESVVERPELILELDEATRREVEDSMDIALDILKHAHG